MKDKIREMQEKIKGNCVCIGRGYSYIILKKAYVCDYGDNGITILNEAHLNSEDHKDIVCENLREIIDIQRDEIQGNVEYRVKTLDRSEFIIEIISQNKIAS